MARNNSVPVVLLGRYTTLAGTTRFKTIPIDVSGYSWIDLVVWRGDMDPGGTFTFNLETSMDQETWVTKTSDAIGSDQQVEVGASLTRTWLRAVVELGASSSLPFASCYAVGYLLRRKA